MQFVAGCQGMKVVYSRAQRTRRVHIGHPECDTDFGKAAACGSKIAAQNAELNTAWDVSRNMASMTWCMKCRKKWPENTAEVLLVW